MKHSEHTPIYVIYMYIYTLTHTFFQKSRNVLDANIC